MELWKQQERIYEGSIFSVEKGKVILDDGTEAHREIVVHGGGVALVPLIDNQIILVRQFRIAVGDYVNELPAGRLEPGETPEECARRELEEEIGYRAGSIIHVASCYCSPGFTNEMDHIYLALDLIRTRQDLEYDECIELIYVPVSAVRGMLSQRLVNDSKTIIGFHALLDHLEK